MTQETEIKVLQQEIDELKKHFDENCLGPQSDPVIAKLVTENIKLKHRLAILNRVRETALVCRISY